MTGPQTGRGHRRARGAFTLIELLVVIAIIAILIGLIVPGLGRAMYTSKEVRCLNNLKQIGFGWNVYLKEHGKFPPQGQFNWGGVDWYDDAPSGFVGGDRPVNPYIGATLHEKSRAEIFMCPLDNGAKYYGQGNLVYWFAGQSAAEDRGQTIFAQIGTSYRANEWIWTVVGKRGWQLGVPGYNQTESNTPEMAADPSKFVLVGDFGPFLAGRYSVQARTAAGVVYAWWHGEEVCTMSFLDGSVRRLRMTPGTAATSEYHFYLNPFKQPANSWVYASSASGTPQAPTHPYAYDYEY
mgnify:CR=1 FL=1